MQSILLELNKTSTVIEASAIISNDGLIVASALPADFDEDHLGKMSASVLLLGEYTSQEYASGDLEHVLIECANNHIVITRVAEDVLLTVMLKSDTQGNPVAPEIKRTCKKISAYLANLELAA